MPNVVPFCRRTERATNLELQRALEGALELVKTGKCRSAVLGFLDERGEEYVIVTGAYDSNVGMLSTFGFRLQALAADSNFG